MWAVATHWAHVTGCPSPLAVSTESDGVLGPGTGGELADAADPVDVVEPVGAVALVEAPELVGAVELARAGDGAVFARGAPIEGIEPVSAGVLS